MKRLSRRGQWWMGVTVLAAVVSGILLWSNRPPKIEVDGEMSAEEVRVIIAAVDRKPRKPLLDDFSWASFRQVVARWKERSRTRVRRIERRTGGFAVAYSGTSEQMEQDGCVFWSVFLEEGKWVVADGIQIPGARVNRWQK